MWSIESHCLTKAALYAFPEKELRKLAKGHNDILGMHIPIYEVTVTVTASPTNMAATESADDAMVALRAALHALEREVRSKREKLRGD
jgi:hypothetical protein